MRGDMSSQHPEADPQAFMKAMFSGFHQGGWGDLGGGCKGQWRMKKATVVSAPAEALSGSPGETIFAEIEIKNEAKRPWKPEASLVSNFSSNTALLLDEVVIPIDFPVEADQTFKLAIPMKIKDSAQLSEFSTEKEHTAEFTF